MMTIMRKMSITSKYFPDNYESMFQKCKRTDVALIITHNAVYLVLEAGIGHAFWVLFFSHS